MKQEWNFSEGEILAFDKPLTWTSFNLVKMVRNSICRKLGVKKLKVGHAGTLDPLASGVLIICTGKATKQIDRLQAGTKEYIATLRLGCTTPSFDAEHEIDATYPTTHITKDLVDATLPRFLGSIMQVPPVFSAVKVDGKRAYDYVRNDEEVELKAKELIIDEIELLDLHLPDQGLISPHADEVAKTCVSGISIKGESDKRKQTIEQAKNAQQSIADKESIDIAHFSYLTIRVVCSKGTYIRALARDIGQALGSGAYLIGLRRTRIGDIKIDQCMQAADWNHFIDNITIINNEN